MIYNNNHINNVSSNLGESSTFKIAMNAKTFRMLSDTLYSDKIKAIVRELSCNAYDAHIMANTLHTEKIEINLPTILTPIFSIRDYGTGMSHNMLLANYLTYGESTKDDSNDTIGCFGIGSKSPFAYTDSFVVISYYEGMENSYNVYLDNGIPQCVLVNSIETTEKNGLLVQFNVETNDINKFEEASKKVFKYFDILPTFNLNLKIEEDRFDIDNELYSIRYGYSSTPRMEAIQGNICYPIDRTMLNKINFKCSHIVLKCNIGDFGFAPSREAISYDQITIDNLNEKLAIIEEEFIKEIIKDIKSSNNLGEFSLKIRQYNTTIDFSDSLIQKYELDSFNGTTIDYKYYKHLELNEKQIFYTNVSDSNRTTNLTTKRNTRNVSLISFYLYDKFKFIYNDLGKKGTPSLIINSYKKSVTNDKKCLLINCDSDTLLEIEEKYGKLITLSNYVKYDEEALKKEKKELALQKKLEQEKEDSDEEQENISNSNIYVLKAKNSWTSEIIFKSFDEDFNSMNEYYYLPLVSKTKRKTIIKLLNEDYDVHENKSFIFLFKDKKVLFMKQTKIDKLLKKMNNLKCFNTYIMNSFEKEFELYFKLMSHTNDFDKINSGLAKFIKNHSKDLKNINDDFKHFLRLSKINNRFYNKVKYNNNIHYTKNSNLFKFIVNKLDLNDKTNGIIKEYNVLTKNFPLLKYVNDNNCFDKEFKDYVLERATNKYMLDSALSLMN